MICVYHVDIYLMHTSAFDAHLPSVTFIRILRFIDTIFSPILPSSREAISTRGIGLYMSVGFNTMRDNLKGSQRFANGCMAALQRQLGTLMLSPLGNRIFTADDGAAVYSFMTGGISEESRYAGESRKLRPNYRRCINCPRVEGFEREEGGDP